MCAGKVSRIRLLGDYAHATRIAFVEFIEAEGALAALNCSGALLGECRVPCMAGGKALHCSSLLSLPPPPAAFAGKGCRGSPPPPCEKREGHSCRGADRPPAALSTPGLTPEVQLAPCKSRGPDP